MLYTIIYPVRVPEYRLVPDCFGPDRHVAGLTHKMAGPGSIKGSSVFLLMNTEGPYKDTPSPTAWYWPSDSETKLVWNKPTGLLKCARCERWTCFNDEADGKCRHCLGY